MQQIVEQYKQCVANKQECYWYFTKKGSYSFFPPDDSGWYQATESFNWEWYLSKKSRPQRFWGMMWSDFMHSTLSGELILIQEKNTHHCWMKCDKEGNIKIACNNDETKEIYTSFSEGLRHVLFN